jgi:hypothetical protein
MPGGVSNIQTASIWGPSVFADAARLLNIWEGPFFVGLQKKDRPNPVPL